MEKKICFDGLEGDALNDVWQDGADLGRTRKGPEMVAVTAA